MERRTLGHLHSIKIWLVLRALVLYHNSHQPLEAERRDHLNIHNILWFYGFLAAAYHSTASTIVGVCELVIL